VWQGSTSLETLLVRLRLKLAEGGQATNPLPQGLKHYFTHGCAGRESRGRVKIINHEGH
jgi:hypothetical protein